LVQFIFGFFLTPDLVSYGLLWELTKFNAKRQEI
jgi:hypothetical protein